LGTPTLLHYLAAVNSSSRQDGRIRSSHGVSATVDPRESVAVTRLLLFVILAPIHRQQTHPADSSQALIAQTSLPFCFPASLSGIRQFSPLYSIESERDTPAIAISGNGEPDSDLAVVDPHRRRYDSEIQVTEEAEPSRGESDDRCFCCQQQSSYYYFYSCQSSQDEEGPSCREVDRCDGG
jgi:hypothetical protein